MDASAGFFRHIGIFPDKTKWAFKNIMQTYDSLIELNEPHLQPDGQVEQYGDLIQAILTLVVASSSPESQAYSPFQKPKTQMLNNHNGMFIAKLTEKGILSHLANWIRLVSQNDLRSILENEKFKIVDQNINALLSNRILKSLMKEVLNSDHIPLMVEDFAHVIYDANGKSRDSLIDIFFDSVYLLANNKNELAEKNILKFIKLICLNYDKIRELFIHKNTNGFINFVSETINKFSQLQQSDQASTINMLAQVMESLAFNEMTQLFKSQHFWQLISELVDSVVSYSQNPDYNTGFMSQMLDDELLTFAPLQKMINSVWERDHSLQYFENIISLLSKQSGGKTNLEHALVELFVNKQDELDEFLTDMFDKFYRHSSSLSH